MSDIVNAGFEDDVTGFQVQFIENEAGDANLEMVARGERKFGASSTYLVAVKAGTSSVESLNIESSSGQTVLSMANSEKCTVIVRHGAGESSGTCKLIPVGVIDGVGVAPLGELEFTAGPCKIEPDSTFYYSDAQTFDCQGFDHVMFLVSDLSTGNYVYVWAGPGVEFSEEPVE